MLPTGFGEFFTLMNKLKVASKRVRPLLGTFLEIALFTNGDFSLPLTLAFEEASRLEKIFNLKDPASEINNLSIENSPVFSEVLLKAEEFFSASEGAFSPYLETGQKLDLNGIAKGFIVDKIVESILQENSSLSGSVNAGGDLRYFNCPEKTVNLQLGPLASPVFRKLRLAKNAVASSSMSPSKKDNRSSTRYRQVLRSGLSESHTVTVMADTCIVADALTKVALFANSEVAQNCSLFYKAQVMIFDATGELFEVFGEQ